jgi:hypothetical protein
LGWVDGRNKKEIKQKLQTTIKGEKSHEETHNSFHRSGPAGADGRFDGCGSYVTLSITTATAGSDPVQATDNGSFLRWTANGDGTAAKEITVSIDAAPPAGLNLYVVSSAPTVLGGGGTPSPVAELQPGISAVTFIETVQKTRATAILNYRLTADVDANIVTGETRTVTYSIVES